MSSGTGRGEGRAGEDGRAPPARRRSAPSLRRSAWMLVAAAGSLIAYQFLAHRALAQGPAGAWVAVAPLLAATALAWRSRLRWAIALLAAGAVAWLWTRPGDAPVALLGLHVGIYALLLWVFARTLRRGREPLVTAIARRVRGALPPEVAHYTRRVTQAWCLFFACMGTASVALFLFAPLSAWSLFVNLLNLPLIGAMFVIEYLVRIARFRHLQHYPIAAAVRAFRSGAREAAQHGRE